MVPIRYITYQTRFFISLDISTISQNTASIDLHSNHGSDQESQNLVDPDILPDLEYAPPPLLLQNLSLSQSQSKAMLRSLSQSI